MELDKRHKVRIAAIVQLPEGVSPGQRFRFEHWIKYLDKENMEMTFFPFLDQKTYQILYKPGNYIQKILGTVKGFIKRFLLLFSLRKYDFIFLQREVTPIGLPVFEWIIAKILNKKIIYDFDDAIWITYSSSFFMRFIKCAWKVKYICKWSYKVSVGNEYLLEYARQFSKHTVLLPTVVDTQVQYCFQKEHTNAEVLTIGWTGSHSTLKYLHIIAPVLKKLQEKINYKFIVIADRAPELGLSNQTFIKWNVATEIKDLMHIDIGIMPLEDDPSSKGKCGFKLIQYLALGIPAVASPVGVNSKIVEEGKTGFLCQNDTQWYASLHKLLLDTDLRKKYGASGRKKIIEAYSIEANLPIFLSLFRN